MKKKTVYEFDTLSHADLTGYIATLFNGNNHIFDNSHVIIEVGEND